eukprot:11177697-Lingulodinium_polyedra.AAC.1
MPPDPKRPDGCSDVLAEIVAGALAAGQNARALVQAVEVLAGEAGSKQAAWERRRVGSAVR